MSASTMCGLQSTRFGSSDLLMGEGEGRGGSMYYGHIQIAEANKLEHIVQVHAHNFSMLTLLLRCS